MPTSSATVSPARRIAFDHLQRLSHDDAYIERLSVDHDDPRVRRQTRDLVAGVTRWRRWLDFLLADTYHGDYDSMELRLQQVLRLGLYELLFQETPAHAAVHEYVELAKQRVRPGAAGLVNGVLRTLDRSRDALPSPDTDDRADALGIRYSHPTWMVRRWMDRYGLGATRALLAYNNKRPSYGLRINPLRTTVDEVAEWLRANAIGFVLSPYVDDVIRVESLQPILQAGWLDEGRVAVQDESAGLVVRAVDPQPGESIIDTCAAPGGKTIAMATRMQGTGHLRAFDVHAGRLRRVDAAAATYGVETMIETEAADLRDVADRFSPPTADRVLLDAPCSGLGVLSKRADLRWQRSPDDLSDLTTLQDELLDAAARLVRPGGRLIYSTCTITPEENAERVEAFVHRHPGFRHVPASGLPESLRSDDGDLATLPHHNDIDGAYAACLQAPNE